jgi:hypothetical protein
MSETDYRGKETVMKASLEKVFGYQGDNMNLPVGDLAAALPFYETVLGFRVLSRGQTPHNSAVLARDQVQIGLAENGGDPTQDGCAFHVKQLEGLFAEFKANGLQKETLRVQNRTTRRSSVESLLRRGPRWPLLLVR